MTPPDSSPRAPANSAKDNPTHRVKRLAQLLNEIPLNFKRAVTVLVVLIFGMGIIYLVQQPPPGPAIVVFLFIFFFLPIAFLLAKVFLGAAGRSWQVSVFIHLSYLAMLPALIITAVQHNTATVKDWQLRPHLADFFRICFYTWSVGLLVLVLAVARRSPAATEANSTTSKAKQASARKRALEKKRSRFLFSAAYYLARLFVFFDLITRKALVLSLFSAPVFLWSIPMVAFSLFAARHERASDLSIRWFYGAAIFSLVLTALATLSLLTDSATTFLAFLCAVIDVVVHILMLDAVRHYRERERDPFGMRPKEKP